MTKDKSTPTDLTDADLEKASGGNFEEIKVTFKDAPKIRDASGDARHIRKPPIANGNLGSGR